MYIYDGFDIIIIFGGSEINRAHIVQKGLLCEIKYRNDKNVDINILFAFFLHVQCKFARINYVLHNNFLFIFHVFATV